MKRIVRLTESDLKRIVRRVLKEEETNPQDKITELNTRIVGQPLNFYLIGDSTQPLISQFVVDEVNFGQDMNSIRISGKIKDQSNPISKLLKLETDIDLMYRCQEQDVFIITKKGTNSQIHSGLWLSLIKEFVKKKMEFANVASNDKKIRSKEMVKQLYKKNPAPLVKPGINEKSGKTLLNEIKNIICSENKMGRAVPKSADSASTNQGFDQNMS